MNILIIPSWYSNKKNPIKGSFFREQALALSRKGHTVNIIYVSLHPRNEFFSKAHFKTRFYQDEGVGVYRISLPSFGIERSKKAFFYIQFQLYKKIIKTILKKQRIDIIHAHSYYPAGYMSTNLKNYFSIPFVVTEHSSKIVLNNLSAEKKDFLAQTVNIADCFICVSNYLKESVEAITGTKKTIEILPNLVSPLFYYEKKIEENQKFVITSVGSLISLKRHDLLINAFNDAFKTNENVILEIIGVGPEYSNLEMLIKNLKLGKKVKLLGGLSREETALKMRKSDMFALISSLETFGVVYIEALASGLPVLSVNNGGSQDIIKDAEGLICKVDNREDITNGLTYMYENRSKYNSEEISQRSLNLYSEENVSEKLLNIYSSVIKSRVK